MPRIPRKEIRVPVEGTIVYSAGLATQGGTVKDISMHGCLVESDQPPHPASLVSYRIVLPGLDEPIEVRLALVQWVQDHTFGLKNVETSAETQKRLRRFLDDNYVQLARAKRRRPRSRPASPVNSQSGARGTPSGPLPSASRLEGGLAVPDAEPAAAMDCLEDPVAILPQDLSAFVGWILDARHAFEEKEPLPVPPWLEFEEFKACTRFIQALLDQSQTAQSRSVESAPRAPTQHEVMALLLTQLKADTDHGAVPSAVSQSADVPQEQVAASADGEQPFTVADRAERRAGERRSVPRSNKPRPLPLSVRLARLTAKLKLPFWFARV